MTAIDSLVYSDKLTKALDSISEGGTSNGQGIIRFLMPTILRDGILNFVAVVNDRFVSDEPFLPAIAFDGMGLQIREDLSDAEPTVANVVYRLAWVEQQLMQELNEEAQIKVASVIRWMAGVLDSEQGEKIGSSIFHIFGKEECTRMSGRITELRQMIEPQE